MAFHTLINGISGSALPVTDRGLAYGDGVFETFRILDGKSLLFKHHWQRLTSSLERLGIPLPLTEAQLLSGIETLLQGGSGVVKLMVTRGSGGRGYRFPDPVNSQWILQASPLPEAMSEHYLQGVSVRTCHMTLSEQPLLAGIKHLNRLEQVMARGEWQDEYFEGLLFSRSNMLIEATMANLFVIQGDQLLTPELDLCGVRGVMRDAILNTDVTCLPGITELKESSINADDLQRSAAVFICNGVRGIIPVSYWYDAEDKLRHQWDSADHPAVIALMKRFHKKLQLPFAGHGIADQSSILS